MITVDYDTQVISVPQSFLTFVSGTLYSLDTEAFRTALHDLQDDEVGMPFPDFFAHNTQVTVAGVTYARTIEIINGYTVEFEDGQYAVRLEGSNNNIFDEGIIVRNQVSVIPTNSAGLQVVTQGSGLSSEQDAKITDLHRIHGLETGTDLEIEDTERRAGSITQTISDDGTTTTVSRQ